jgi:5-methylcytosine-specific restriction endonuclease McrA
MTVKQVERKANKIAASTEIRLNWAEQIRNKIAKKRHVNYYAYLKSPEWKRKKFEIEQSARYKCQVCNKGKSQAILNVHHRTYERLGCELPSDLIVLCRECHALYHGKLLPPQNEAQQSVQRTGGESGQQSLFSAGEVLPAKVTRQSPRR